MVEENVSSRLINIKSEVKMVFNAIENLTKQMESIHGKLTPTPASIEVILSQPSASNDQAIANDGKMPMLEDDLLPLAIRKAELVSTPITEHDKRFAKVEKMLK